MRLGTLVVMALITHTAVAADDATRVRELLRTHCYECHGLRRESDPNFDVTDYDYLTNRKAGLVVPGDTAASRVLQRAGGDRPEMPPRDSGKLTLSKDEKALLYNWIKDGAKTWDAPRSARDLLSDVYTRDAIGLYAITQKPSDLTHYRYLELVTLFNEGVSADEIKVHHDAVSKVCNSATDPDHMIKQNVEPLVLDELGLVIRLDLRAYGWTGEDWDQIRALNPYGVGLSGALRADWFCYALSRPRAYYALTGTPKRELDLERKLGVDRSKASVRAGVTDSPVSAHDRLIVRRETKYGGYYYRGLNVLEPTSVVKTALDFPHKYVTAMYELPNHRPAFVAFEAENKEQRVNGVRSDDVDPRAEADPAKTSGSFTPLVPVSCVCCHTTAVQPNVRDVVRTGIVVRGDGLLDRVKSEFVPQTELTKILMDDRQRYINNIGVDEPLKPVVLRYNRPLNLQRAAADRGVEPNVLSKLINDKVSLWDLGLRPLLDGRTVTRDAWHGQARAVTKLLGKE